MSGVVLKKKSGSKGLSATFAQRGVSVSFTTPALKYTRLRIRNNKKWEALLSGLPGGHGTYVIPWHSLPEMISLSLHDRALFDLIKSQDDAVPAALRQHVLAVQADGYDGPDKAMSAQGALEQDSVVERALHHGLIMTALDQMGDDLAQGITAHDLANPSVMARVHQALDQAGNSMGVPGEQIVSWLGRWSELVLPAGEAESGECGYLMEMLRAIADFTASLQKWAEDETSATAAMANQVADAASMSGRLAMELLEKLALLEQNMPASLKAWPQTSKMIAKLVSRASWVLDGWDRLLEQWQAEAESPRFRQRELIAQLVQNLPVLPEEALNANQAAIWKNYRKSQENWANLSLHGGDPELDQDLQEILNVFPTEED